MIIGDLCRLVCKKQKLETKENMRNKNKQTKSAFFGCCPRGVGLVFQDPGDPETHWHRDDEAIGLPSFHPGAGPG